MKAKVSLPGIIEEYAGHTSLDMEMKEGATVGDLLEVTAERCGERMPLDLWDPLQEGLQYSCSESGTGPAHR